MLIVADFAPISAAAQHTKQRSKRREKGEGEAERSGAVCASPFKTSIESKSTTTIVWGRFSPLSRICVLLSLAILDVRIRLLINPYVSVAVSTKWCYLQSEAPTLRSELSWLPPTHTHTDTERGEGGSAGRR